MISAALDNEVGIVHSGSAEVAAEMFICRYSIISQHICHL